MVAVVAVVCCDNPFTSISILQVFQSDAVLSDLQLRQPHHRSIGVAVRKVPIQTSVD
jgi:hypothetical protein